MAPRSEGIELKMCTLFHASSSTRFDGARVFASNDASIKHFQEAEV